VETVWQMAKQKGWRDPSGRLIEGDAYSLGERLTTAAVTLIVVLSQDHPNSRPVL
jgi:hypothetical protein